MDNKNSVFFSIIIPTRNRPELFQLALKSVLEQSFTDKEVIVVNDGSTDKYLAQYKNLEKKYSSVKFHYLIRHPNGHGQSHAMNFGVNTSLGKYLCFLDDDDHWTDLDHLKKTHSAISNYPHKVDLHYSNQKAYFSSGKQQTNNVWIEDLISKVPSSEASAVDTSLLLTSNGFAHLNCSIFRKDFYQSIKGMNEGIRYECDRDLYIRSIDAAKHILYNPDFTSEHHIPDPAHSDNMSTMISIFEKKLFQLNVYDSAILLCKRKDIKKFCQKAKGHQLKHITEALYKTGRHQEATYYARQALVALPSLKWFIFTLVVSLKAMTQLNEKHPY